MLAVLGNHDFGAHRAKRAQAEFLYFDLLTALLANIRWAALSAMGGVLLYPPYVSWGGSRARDTRCSYDRLTGATPISGIGSQGLSETVADRLEWGRMRMSPTDILDVSGATYTYLINGQPPGANWTALFRPGERVRFVLINDSMMEQAADAHRARLDAQVPRRPRRAPSGHSAPAGPIPGCCPAGSLSGSFLCWSCSSPATARESVAP
jgi:hypothetical protein